MSIKVTARTNRGIAETRHDALRGGAERIFFTYRKIYLIVFVMYIVCKITKIICSIPDLHNIYRVFVLFYNLSYVFSPFR